MTAAAGAAPTENKPDLRKAVIRRVIQVFGQVAVLGAILFISAGRLDWTWAWVYLGLSVGSLLAFMAVALPGHSELVAERSQTKQGTKRWDRILTAILFAVALAMYVVAGLDARFGWTGDLPLWVHVAAAAAFLLTGALTYWAMLTNRFFATTVRIQEERGHVVVAGGPYRFVRHPGYVGIVAGSLAAMLLLGSLWALVPGAIDLVVYIVRTALEDRTLQAELPGYKEYTQKTRYRLLPGVW